MNALNQLRELAALMSRFGLLTTRFLFSTLVAAALIAAWALTAPLFQCYDVFARNSRDRARRGI